MRVKILLLATIALAAISFAGCSHMPGKSNATGSSGDRVADAIASAAQDAAKGGRNADSLMFQEKLYRDDPRNEKNIIAYAHGLRRVGRVDDAKLVIRTPAADKKASAPLLTECAMVLVAGGEYDDAADFAERAIARDGKSADAHHAYALALSGLGKNEAAQTEFERARDLWPANRDTTAIVNNLAMSLAAQGKMAEARQVMTEATGQALDSPAYQNNRAMLSALRDEPAREKLAEPTATPERKPAKGGKAAAIKAKMKPIVE